MFNVGGGELLLILFVALVVLGPDKLPDTARKIGNVVGELRRMSSGFQQELRDAMEAPTKAVAETFGTSTAPTQGEVAPAADATEAMPSQRRLEPVADDDAIRPVDPTGRSDDPAA